MAFNFEHVINGLRYQTALIEGQSANLQNNPLFLIPFEIVQGALWMTNNGMESLLESVDGLQMPFDPSNNTQSTFTFTGNGPVCVRWKNSINPVIESGSKVTSFLKNFQVGDYYTIYPTSNFNASQELGEVSVFGQTYKNLSTTLRFEGTMSFSAQTPINWENMLRYVWILQGANYTNKQLLILKSYDAILNSQTNEVQSFNVSFESLNLNYSQTGKEILQFINFSMPGDNYAFPKIYDGSWTLPTGQSCLLGKPCIDPLYANTPLGVTSIQEEHSYAYSFSSFNIQGGISNKEKILPAQKLLVYQPQPPISDKLQLNGSATNDYYVWWAAQPTMEGQSSSWRTALNNATFNGYEREIVGGLSQSPNIQDTNPGSALQTKSPFYFSKWQILQNTGADIVFPNITSQYFGSSPGNFTFHQTTNGKPTTYNLAQFFNHNSIIYDNYYQFTNDISESVRFSLTDIPIFGKLFSKLAGGLDPTWSLSTNIIQNGWPLNLLTPTTTYNLAQMVVGDTAGYINGNHWNEEDNVNADGGKLNISSMRFTLTDRYYDPTKIEPAGYILTESDIFFGNEPTNGIYNTIFLGQTIDPLTGNPITFNQGNPLWYNNDQIVPVLPSKQAQINGFYIAGYKSQGYGSSNVSLTFYSHLNALDLTPPIYWNVYKNNAAVKKIYSLWTNMFSFSLYEGNITDNISVVWPALLKSLEPSAPSPIVLNLNVEVPIYIPQNAANQNADLVNVPYTINQGITRATNDEIAVNTNFNAFNLGLQELVDQGVLNALEGDTNINLTKLNSIYFNVKNSGMTVQTFTNDVSQLTLQLNSLNLMTFTTNQNGLSSNTQITSPSFMPSTINFPKNANLIIPIPNNFWEGVPVNATLDVGQFLNIEQIPLLFQKQSWISKGVVNPLDGIWMKTMNIFSLSNFGNLNWAGDYNWQYTYQQNNNVNLPYNLPSFMSTFAANINDNTIQYAFNFLKMSLSLNLQYDTKTKLISYSWNLIIPYSNSGNSLLLPSDWDATANFGLTLTNFVNAEQTYSKVGGLNFSIINSTNL